VIAESFPSLFFQQVEAKLDRVAFRRKSTGYGRAHMEGVRRQGAESAAGLLALGVAGDRVPSWGKTAGMVDLSSAGHVNRMCHLWCVFHVSTRAVAMWSAFGIRGAFRRHEEQVDKSFRSCPSQPETGGVWDPRALGFHHPDIFSLRSSCKRGRSTSGSTPRAFQNGWGHRPQQPPMIYTSGTPDLPRRHDHHTTFWASPIPHVRPSRFMRRTKCSPIFPWPYLRTDLLFQAVKEEDRNLCGEHRHAGSEFEGGVPYRFSPVSPGF